MRGIGGPVRPPFFMTAAEIVAALAKRRRKLGINKGRLAKRVGVGASRIRFWESRRQNPRLDSFIAWAEELGYDVELKERQ